jgi:putative DNA primase/helicase
MQMTDDDFPFEEAPWPDAPPDNLVPFPGAVSTEVSEDSIALAFTREHGATMRFDHDAGKWFQWSMTHWRSLAIPAAFHYAREIGRRLGSGKKQVCKASVAGGAERFARADPNHAVTSAVWDQDPWLLGTPGGTLDLRTGRMHQPRPEEGITKLTGCQPERKDPALWLQFLNDATRGDAEMMTYLQRIAGYCLTGLTNEHALFFIYGPGGNGKSVFLNILVHILGAYAVSAPMDTFTSSKFSSHPTELAMLKGARLVTASETEKGKAWAESRIKALTGGDPITARFMAKDFFTYQPQFKLLFAGNHQPTLSNIDPAMRRRFNMMPFVHKPTTPDHMLEEKLKSEAPRILAWALQGCLDWQAHGLGRPESVTEATNDYFANQDLIGQWIADCCNADPSAWDTPTRLYRSWTDYARRAGEDAGTSKDFGDTLHNRGFARKASNGIRKHLHIAVNSDGSDGE